MASGTRLERRLDRWIARAGKPRSAAVVIASATTSITVAAGLLMTVTDHKSFPSVGSGLWWAVQTVTTVGYGDVVPLSVAGRILAGVVMLLGIGFLTVITASITSAFVAQSGMGLPGRSALGMEELRALDERLERIEAALSERT
jgi:voltage-gated potassium channel